MLTGRVLFQQACQVVSRIHEKAAVCFLLLVCHGNADDDLVGSAYVPVGIANPFMFFACGQKSRDVLIKIQQEKASCCQDDA